MKFTQKTIRELLDYDPETGLFVWRPRHNGGVGDNSFNAKYSGKKAGAIGLNGYVFIGTKRRTYYAHRLAWLYVYGDIPNQIDHINRVTHDNRIANLRLASQGSNQANAGLRRHNTSGFKGVCWSKKTNNWAAQIRKGLKAIHIGHFKCPIEAAKAYDKKAIELFGEFACTNKELGLY